MNAEIIERLKKEKAEFEKQYIDKGKKDGMDWAQSAAYSDLKYAATADFDDLLTDTFNNEVLGDYFNGVCIENPSMGESSFRSGEANEEFKQWLNGWADAVTAFWDEVSKQLNAA